MGSGLLSLFRSSKSKEELIERGEKKEKVKHEHKSVDTFTPLSYFKYTV